MPRSIFAILALMVCAKCGYADIQARVLDAQGNYHNVFVPPLASGSAVTLNTAESATAAGRTDFDVVWLFDTASESGSASGSIGPVTLEVGFDSQQSAVLPREIRVIAGRPPSASNPDPQNSGNFGDFRDDPVLPILFPGALNFRSLTVAPELLPTTRVVIAVSGDVGIDPAINNGIRDVIGGVGAEH